jgi:molecular chaperone GrpE
MKDKNNEEEDIVFEAANEDGETEELANPQAALKKLREKLKQCQEERQEFLEMSQRLKADYVNLKRDEEKRRTEMMQFAKSGLLLEMLDLADSFDLAFANKQAWESVNENWRKGVEYIYGKLISVFEQNGLEMIDPLGKTFNPEEHHSVAAVKLSDLPDTEAGDNKVLEVVQKGYKLNGRVLRPAKVKVGHKV